MRVPINLASHPGDSTRALRLCAIALGGIMIVLAGIAVRSELRSRNEFRSLVDRGNQLEAEIGELESARAEMQDWLETPQVTQIRQRSALLNSLIQQKSLSWTRLFQDLESTLPAGVRIITILPKTEGADIAEAQPELGLTVAAASVEPIVDFIRKLEDSEQFANPVVANQRFPTADDPEPEVLVSLTTRYVQSLLPVKSTGAAGDEMEAKEEAVEEIEDTEAEIDPDAPAVEPQATAVSPGGSAGVIAAGNVGGNVPVNMNVPRKGPRP